MEDELGTEIQDPEVQALLESGAQVRDVLEQIVALTALGRMVKERDEILRKFLRIEASRIEAETGGAMNVPIKGIGRVYMTQPGERLVPTDDAEFGAWLVANYPDRVEIRTRVNSARLAAMCREDPELAERLTKAGVIEDEVVPDAKLHADVLNDTGRSSAGGLVDRATGSILAAVAQHTGRPTLTVKAEAKAIERAKRAIIEGGIPEVRPFAIEPAETTPM